MPKLNVTRSIEINASPEKIFNILSDFSHWTAWSPWLIMEPEAKVTVSEDKKYYHWEGVRTGSGEMKLVSEKPNQSIDIDLTFLKPWKSKSKIRFEINPKADQSTVTWIMDGGLPFFFFFMKKMMEAFVGMDFQRGLFLLKDYVEDGAIHSKLTMKGKSMFPGCQYVGIRSSCAMNAVGESMRNDFDKLTQWVKSNGNLVNGAPFSIYHNWDIVGGKVDYTSAFPVQSHPDSIPSDFLKGSIPGTEIYTVVHTGPYRHLGNAWSAQNNLSRSKVYKVNKSIHPFEVYLSMPGTVADNELVTEICFPAK